MRLLLDMDGPLADFDGWFWHVMSELLCYEFDVEGVHEQTARYFTNHMPVKEQRDHARRLVEQAGWFDQLPVVDGAHEGVEALLSAGVEIVVCTKPLEENPTCRTDKWKWLKRNFPGMGLEKSMILAPDKSMIRGAVLLDDAPKMRWLARDASEWSPVVFTAPYNVTGSVWESLPHWSWGDPIEELLRHG